MYKYIRLVILISLALGIIFVAQDKVAWADRSSQPSLSARQDDAQSVLPAPKDDCKDKNKNKDKCKGTVKPPPRGILISVTGDYSVGGLCTLSIVLNDPNINLDATIKTPLPRELPETVHKVRQGCLLTYYASGERIDELSPASGNAAICFASTPQKQTIIYFYNIYSVDPVWAPLETTDQNGIACATAIKSGVYVATFQSP